MKHTLLFATIASVLTINSVFAESQTIPTQSYVNDNFQTKIPAGTNGTIVTYTDTAGTLGIRGVWDDDNESAYNSYNNLITYQNGIYADVIKAEIPTMGGLTGVMKWMMPANGSGFVIKNRPSGDTNTHFLPEFADTSGRWYRIRTANSVDENIGGWTKYNVLPTLAALDSGLETKQNKMTCAQYIDNAEQTDENCLLWNMN